MPLLAYTTTIAVEKTAGEIQRILAAHGARRVVTDFDAQGNPVALSFVVQGEHGSHGYRLPVNAEGVWRVLTKQREAGKINYRYATREQAARTAWRILKEWTEAQMAILEAGMVALDEVLLPYAIVPTGQTLYQAMTEEQFKMLGSGEGGHA